MIGDANGAINGGRSTDDVIAAKGVDDPWQDHESSIPDTPEPRFLGGQAVAVVVLLAILTLTVATAIIFATTFSGGLHEGEARTGAIQTVKQAAITADKVEWLYAKRVPTRIIAVEPPK